MDFRCSVKKQARYQPVINCTYWQVMGPYKNWNIIHLSPKSIPSEAFDEINQVVLDRISENMASLVQLDMYGAINTDDNTTNVFYLIKLLSDAYTLQNNATIDRQVISDGELVVKAQYLCSMQENTNCYWKQQTLQQTIIFPTRTILHPRLEVIIIRYVQDIPKKLCGRNKAKKGIQRHPIIVTDADYNYIMDEIERRETIEFERNVSVKSDDESN